MKRLPDIVLEHAPRLFWDVELASIDPVLHEDFILGRVLDHGTWDDVRALRTALGDAALRSFVARAPHRLDRRSLAFYRVVLGLEPSACATTSFRRNSAPLFAP